MRTFVMILGLAVATVASPLLGVEAYEAGFGWGGAAFLGGFVWIVMLGWVLEAVS